MEDNEHQGNPNPENQNPENPNQSLKRRDYEVQNKYIDRVREALRKDAERRLGKLCVREFVVYHR